MTLKEKYPIPERLNLLLLVVFMILIALCFVLPDKESTVQLLIGAVVFGFVMQPAYSLLHESLHGNFSGNDRINRLAGQCIAFFLPSGYELFKKIHQGHHLSNRSKRERIEFYGANEPAWKRGIFYYGVLIILNWVGFVLQNTVFSSLPVSLIRRHKLDKSFGATLPPFSDQLLRRIAWEFRFLVVIYALLIALTSVTFFQVALYLLVGGFFYSQFRYIYHYGTHFDAIEGAYDLSAPTWLSRLMLNSTYHLTHHRHPHVPWSSLPQLARESDHKPGFVTMIFRQWKGPISEEVFKGTEERVISWNEYRKL